MGQRLQCHRPRGNNGYQLLLRGGGGMAGGHRETLGSMPSWRMAGFLTLTLGLSRAVWDEGWAGDGAAGPGPLHPSGLPARAASDLSP